MFTIGKIINTHGIKGEVKVKQISDFSERFDIGSTVYVINEGKEKMPLLIDGRRTQQDLLLLHFKGYDTIESVEALKGTNLMIEEAQLTELAEHEYYYYEIIGCIVYTTEGETIGEIESILSPGANDVWIVQTKENKEILIPYIKDVVKNIDVYNKKVEIELIEGLID